VISKESTLRGVECIWTGSPISFGETSNFNNPSKPLCRDFVDFDRMLGVSIGSFCGHPPNYCQLPIYVHKTHTNLALGGAQPFSRYQKGKTTSEPTPRGAGFLKIRPDSRKIFVD